MKCPRCGSDNREGARFCRECGTTFGTVCVSCGAKVEAGGKFCDSCGVPLTSNLEPATPPSRFGSPDIYTPKHLAERILTSKAALEGERKHVTVLFADLKGSMELLADRDPEEARQILDPILGLMIDAVHRYEGTVNQVMGDGVMALFGAPIAHEDHAVRACFAALRIQESVKRHAEEVRQAIHATIEIRIGLNSGEVVVRSIGGDLRMDYTAIGQTTHLAARLEQMASPGSILISQGTLQVTEGFVHVRSIGSTSVKGLDEPIPVYEVLGPGPVRSRLQGATARGLSPLIGRDTELGHLHAALERAAEGHGQIVAVIGEPGVGKSRLFYEFVQSPATYGWSVQYTDAVGYERSAVYQPVVVLLRRYFGVEARDDRVTIQERVSKKLQALGEVATDAIPVVLALLGALPADDPFRTLDPARRREYTLDALKRLFLRESQIRPLLLVFENLHWIDPETEALLDRLVESLQSVRILLLVNYRPEYQHGWGNKSYYVQLRINPLESEDVEQLLRSLLGTDHTLEPPKQLLMRETDGNPFFLEESVRTLIETKVLVGERGAYQMAKPLQTFHVPPTVQAVLAARIDRLPIQEKHLLQAAAVIGKYIPFIFLKEIADLTEEQLRRCITHLQAAEFLYETRLFPELEYSFKHALTLEVAYGSMLQERRRVLHARIVEVVERFHPERLAEQAERLAHHAFHGELWGKAVTYYRQAAAKVIAQSANRAAVTYFGACPSGTSASPVRSEGSRECDRSSSRHAPCTHSARRIREDHRVAATGRSSSAFH